MVPIGWWTVSIQVSSHYVMAPMLTMVTELHGFPARCALIYGKATFPLATLSKSGPVIAMQQLKYGRGTTLQSQLIREARFSFSVRR